MVVEMAWSAVLACSESCALQLRTHYHERVASIPGWVLLAWALAGGIVSIIAYIRHRGRLRSGRRLTTARPDVRWGRSHRNSSEGRVSAWRGSVNQALRTEAMNGAVLPLGSDPRAKEIPDV